MYTHKTKTESKTMDSCRTNGLRNFFKRFLFHNNGVSNGVHGNGRTPFSTHNYSTSTSYYQQWTFLQEVPVPRRREQMLQNGEPSPPRMVLVS